MSLRHKHAVSPLRPPISSRRDDPATYVLEWSSQTRHRHALATAEELRSEILAGECHGVHRLLIVRGGVDGEVGAVLRDVAGVEDGFLEAHTARKRYKRGTAWCWAYPEKISKTGAAYGFGAGRANSMAVARVSLWGASEIPILLVDRPPPMGPLHTPPKLRHQDAATNPFKLQPSGPYGALGIHVPGTEPSSLEERLWEVLRETTKVEEALGEIVYERWVDFVDTLKPRAARQDEGLLWNVMKALEHNLDGARYLSRRGTELERIKHEDWADMLERVHRRLQLAALAQAPGSTAAHAQQRPSAAQPDDRDVNERSLDRIAYLGGLLLPVTVVSGVLSIEGDYGPEGGNFWVFWVASLVMSVAALSVIYVDQMRSLPVWIEVAAGDAVEAMDVMFDSDSDEMSMDGEVTSEADRSTTYLVERRRDGLRARTWQRKELGWGGAVKRICGWDHWKGRKGEATGPEGRV